MTYIISRSKNLVFFVIVFIIYFFADSWVQPINASQTKEDCNIHETPCVKTIGDALITLDIQPKPVKAMTDLTFRVTVSGKPPSLPPHIDLAMPGMKMGPNQVLLESTGNNTYQGKGVIIKCPSGRRTWQATVIVPDVGTAEFIFDVIY